MNRKNCLICNENRLYYDFSINKYRVEECANCGFMRLNPQPSNQELADHSSDIKNHPDNEAHKSELKSRTADYYLDLLENYTGNTLTPALVMSTL